MNERIKELADQARKALAVDAMGGGEFNMKAYEEKFAELIVKECVKIAYQNDVAKFTRDGYVIGQEIEKHFGVE